MSDPNSPSDHELDQRLRAAAAAFAALAPADRIDQIAVRVDLELADLDRPVLGRAPVETPMTTDPDDKPTSQSIKPPTLRADDGGRTEDSGLHDIKALAKDTRKRISRRITSQHDVDDHMLSASHSGLRAVALPEPAMIVAFPEAPASMAEVRGASPESVAAIATAAAVAGPAPRKRTGMWVGIGGALAAAAAAAVVVSSSGTKKSAQPVAASERAAGPAPTIEVKVDPSAMSGAAVAPDPAPVAAAPAADLTPVVAPAVDGRKPESAHDVVRADPPKDNGEPKDLKDPKDRVAKPTGGSATPTTGDGKTGTKPGGGAAAGAGAGSGSAKPPPGEKSIEDLLNDASGGGGSAKTDDTPAETGPVKSGLEPKEIKAGMSAVAGAAQGCYGKFNEAGHVKVKAVVAPSGSVTKVDATGEFAGTPTGACVAAAVKGASFPSWTGAPMTITYSFTLQE